MYKQSIGIVGGFGAYATLNFYRMILEKFVVSCERDYPHIYMDNDFTMPSRTRALLYGDEYDKVVEQMSLSTMKLCSMGGDIILFACGTAHAFLPEVMENVPEAKNKIVNMLTVTSEYMERTLHNDYRALIIAAEGMLKHRIWSKCCSNVTCIEPDEKYFVDIRYFIEAVKQNNLSNKICDEFIAFIEKFDCRNVVLGCTEFPILIDYMKMNGYENWLEKYNFFNPLDILLEYVKKIIK